MKAPLVSIIIPVYNAAILLENCLSSLKNQTYKSLEIIFINDCSTDYTEEVLLRFQEEMLIVNPDYSIQLIKHSVNQGVASARNTGLSNASGDYIYYVDADDYIAIDGIELLVNKAISTNSDIVGCNWILQFNKNGRKMLQPNVESPTRAIEYMAKGVMRWNLWLFLVKRELYQMNNIQFLDGQNMGEDMMVMFKLLIQANNISMLDKVVYYYSQSNDESLTKVYSQKHKEEVTTNLLELEKINEINFEENFNYLKLNIKLPLLISTNVKQYEEWGRWFPEANSYSLKNNLISKRIRLLQFMASKKQDWFVRLHYYLVIKFIYGIIYK